MIHVQTVDGVGATNVKFNITKSKTKRKDKMKSNVLRKLSGILLFIYSIPLALADESESRTAEEVLRPNLAAGILGLPTEIQDWLTWSISVAFVGVVAFLIILTFKEAILTWWSKKQGKTRERGAHIGYVLYGAGILIIMIIAILLIIFIASSI